MNLLIPWADPSDRVYSTPTSLLIKLRLGEAPEHVPAALDVHECCHDPAHSLDGGPIDRIMRCHAGAMRAAHLHCAARNQRRRGHRHNGYDDVEQVTGVARSFFIKVPRGAPIAQICDRLRQISIVEWVSPNYLITQTLDKEPGLERPLLTDDLDAWAPRHLVGLPEALAHEPGQPTVSIGLIDSGIAHGHPEVKGQLRDDGYDTVNLQQTDVAPGVRLLGDYTENDPNPYDDFVGHGMGCAGIMAAKGVHMPPGLAGACQVLPMRALGAAKLPDKVLPVGLGALSDLDLAITLAVNQGAKVLNLSFGTSDEALTPSSPRPHADTIRYAAERGCILIAASGNSGAHERYWPAAHPEVIAVGAVDAAGQPASFSTKGDHVAISAPGARILTTSLGSYQYATGTSFAAPFVAAAAALCVSRASRMSRSVTGPEMRQILTRSARPFPHGTRHSGAGVGILDAAAALTTLDEMIVQSPGPMGGQHVQ
ncbi:S8 family serine peptidase [Ruegeria sp. Ofav3-42]|uniref:S8 family peptidase n=1 Tax=Ruegeria sp. Ofav3-42 TaxID=2917759 RepID=UPI001EF6EBFE|nr:S8 family serine peptidase [Ruegeria sp. Ofav3-42]MCG7519839.1 S8 family serine peptidase [Ruegeria sp. Ofav3-42]